MARPRFEEFEYTGEDRAEVIDRTIAARQQVYAPTGEMVNGQQQRLATFLTTPTHVDGDEVLVRMTEYADENGRPSGALFDTMIAETTGRRVISTNLPGVDFYGAPDTMASQQLTTEQAAGLRAGSFRHVGGAIMNAVHHTVTAEGLQPNYVILGTSMSAAIAAGALRRIRERDLPVKAATFAEPVNIIRRPGLQLIGQFIATSRTGQGYANMNPPMLRKVSEPVWTIVKRTGNPTNFLYGGALANNGLVSDLGPIDHLEGLPIFMSRGAASVISPKTEFDQLATHLNQVADVETHTYGDKRTSPHDHGYVLTVQSFIDASNSVLARL